MLIIYNVLNKRKIRELQLRLRLAGNLNFIVNNFGIIVVNKTKEIKYFCHARKCMSKNTSN